MKKKLKKILIIILVIVILIPIVPYQCVVYKDGGSRVFKSLTYEICRYHCMEPIWLDGSGGGYFDGWRIEILGHTVRDDYESYSGNSAGN